MEYSLKAYSEFQRHYEGESDRAVGILASSYLENYLEKVVKNKLSEHKVTEKLFEGYGPLATFSAKNDIALALGLITERVHKDINIVRKVRNEFAHETAIINFETVRIKDMCSTLWPAEGIPKSDGTKRIIEGGRSQFLNSIFWCILHIETELERTKKLTIPKFSFMEVVE